MNIHLCFHGIGKCVTEREAGESRYWVSRDLFLRVLDKLPGLPNVELSFDDGNRSDIDIALPALLERGLRATFFPLAGRLRDSMSLSANDLREIRENGMLIGSHGWQHVPWRGLSRVDARREFIDARTELEQAAGTKIVAAALPLGQYERTSLREIKKAGYYAVYTSDRYPARPTSWLQARYSLTSTDTVESVGSILRTRPSPRVARNVLASFVKRNR